MKLLDAAPQHLLGFATMKETLVPNWPLPPRS
jgi:hypothetical protein